MAFVLLAAFGEPAFFSTSFNYTLDEIVKWLQACTRGEKGGERTQDKAVRDLLAQISSKLADLILPKGKEFRNPNLKPDSHFPRTLNSKWIKGVDTTIEAKFKLLSISSTYQGALEKAISVSWWNPYDLLGLFISVLGPAPAGANKNNYFLPLCAVYARWCSRIAGSAQYGWGWKTPGDGEGDWPFMFNITWRPEGKPVDSGFSFFLGSSTAGDKWNQNVVGQWRARVQRQRFDTFLDRLQMKLFDPKSFDNKSAPVQAQGLGSHCFGNCAETYPFIFSIRGTKLANGSLHGLALKREFMKVESLNTYDPSGNGDVWKSLCGPCANCEYLVTRAGADKEKFRWNWEKKYAPKTASRITTSMDEPAITSATMAETDAPDGWSNKPEDMNTSDYWGTNGDGTAAAKRVGLTSPKGLLIADRDHGGDRYIFTDGTTGKVYLWSMVTNEIFEFTKPADLNGIIAQLKLPIDKASVETKQLDEVAG